MTKVIEEAKAYRTEIRIGDVVAYNTRTGTDWICIVTGIQREKKIDGKTVYDLVNLVNGKVILAVDSRDVSLIHHKVILENGE